MKSYGYKTNSFVKQTNKNKEKHTALFKKPTKQTEANSFNCKTNINEQEGTALFTKPT